MAWSVATIAFALLQAAAAYVQSFIFAQTGGDYRLLFLTGAGAIVLALAIDLVTAVTIAQSSRVKRQKQQMQAVPLLVDDTERQGRK